MLLITTVVSVDTDMLHVMRPQQFEKDVICESKKCSYLKIETESEK